MRDSAPSITRHGRPVSRRIFVMTTWNLYGRAERRMRMIENRLKHIAGELAFRTWFRRRRIFETMTADELEAYAVTSQWLDRPEPAVGNESASTRWTGQVSSSSGNRIWPCLRAVTLKSWSFCYSWALGRAGMLGGVSQARFKNLTYSRTISPKVSTFSAPYLGRRGTPQTARARPSMICSCWPARPYAGST